MIGEALSTAEKAFLFSLRLGFVIHTLLPGRADQQRALIAQSLLDRVRVLPKSLVALGRLHPTQGLDHRSGHPRYAAIGIR